jgi:hypothetical protein
LIPGAASVEGTRLRTARHRARYSSKHTGGWDALVSSTRHSALAATELMIELPSTPRPYNKHLFAGSISAHEHHFAVVQPPANLFESGAMLTRNGISNNRTVLEFAREHDLAVLINRPLNAFYRELVVRLADAPVLSIALTREIHSRVNPFLPPAYRTESLARKALAVLMNTQGVTCVLNGMRHPNYVDDSLGTLRSAPFDVDVQLYEVFNHL